jgi:hypothetical protein
MKIVKVHGLGANGIGTSVNSWSSGVARAVQNAIGGSISIDSSGVQSANVATQFFDSVSGVSGITTANGQWYFEAIEYDATLPSNNYKVWLGTTATKIVLVQTRTVASGGIAFGTNATIQIGNRNSNGTRGISSGGVADVRIYAGVCSSNNLEVIRTFNTGFVDDGSGTASAPVMA